MYINIVFNKAEPKSELLCKATRQNFKLNPTGVSEKYTFIHFLENGDQPVYCLVNTFSNMYID